MSDNSDHQRHAAWPSSSTSSAPPYYPHVPRLSLAAGGFRRLLVLTISPTLGHKKAKPTNRGQLRLRPQCGSQAEGLTGQTKLPAPRGKRYTHTRQPSLPGTGLDKQIGLSPSTSPTSSLFRKHADAVTQTSFSIHVSIRFLGARPQPRRRSAHHRTDRLGLPKPSARRRPVAAQHHPLPPR